MSRSKDLPAARNDAAIVPEVHITIALYSECCVDIGNPYWTAVRISILTHRLTGCVQEGTIRDMTRNRRTSSVSLKICMPALLIGAISACSSSSSGDREMAGAGDDQIPPPRTVIRVMADKMSHTYAIMEGIALADYRQVEVNAIKLYDLSQQSDWMVHRTVSYTTFSEKFRGVVLQLANHASEDDLVAVRQDYLAMINSCFECHDYLRRENLISDFPGRLG